MKFKVGDIVTLNSSDQEKIDRYGYGVIDEVNSKKGEICPYHITFDSFGTWSDETSIKLSQKHRNEKVIKKFLGIV